MPLDPHEQSTFEKPLTLKTTEEMKRKRQNSKEKGAVKLFFFIQPKAWMTGVEFRGRLLNTFIAGLVRVLRNGRDLGTSKL